MWGNLLGWAISGVMLVVTGLAIYSIEQAGELTPATELGLDPQNLARMELPVAIGSIAPFISEECDAGQRYRQAIDAYLRNPGPINALADGSVRDGTEHPALELLRAGAACRQADVFVHRPEEVINYARERPQLRALRTLGDALVISGLRHHREGRTDEARRDLEAAFSLGYKLFEERLVYEQLSHGLGLMGSSAAALARVAEAGENTQRAEQLREFNRSLNEFSQQQVMPMWQAISTIDERLIGLHAGDVHRFATESQEPVWRNEAILKLGRYQYHATRRSDQEIARQTVRDLSVDPDPVIGAAGRAARDLTLREHRLLGS